MGCSGRRRSGGTDARSDLGSPQQRTLFALLLLHRNQTVSTDRMADVLWPDAVPSNAVAVLRTYVARLRAGPLPSEALLTRPGGYELRVSPGAVDADRPGGPPRDRPHRDEPGQRGRRPRPP